MIIAGKAFRYGRDVNTDVMLPARYLNILDRRELASHTFEDLDPSFVKEVQPGDVVVAEENFGAGSSREMAPNALKDSGVGAVVAKSFARIFFRNCINVGLPVFVCPEAVAATQKGDHMEIDPGSGEIRNLTRGRTFTAAPLPPEIQAIIAHGGLIESLRAAQREGQS